MGYRDNDCVRVLEATAGKHEGPTRRGCFRVIVLRRAVLRNYRIDNTDNHVVV